MSCHKVPFHIEYEPMTCHKILFQIEYDTQKVPFQMEYEPSAADPIDFGAPVMLAAKRGAPLS